MLARIGDIFGEGSFEDLCLKIGFPLSIIVTAIVGSVFLAEVCKIRFFRVWVLFGGFASMFLAIPIGSSLLISVILAIILGTSLGLGMPLCLSYFKESVSIENRGKVGGIALFVAIFSVPLFWIILSMLDLMTSAMFLAIWRIWTLPFLFSVSEKDRLLEPAEQKVTSMISVLRDRTFSLYFTAWLMFALIDSFQTVVVAVAIGEFQFFIRVVEPICTGFSVLVAGVLSDWIGRKRVLIFGFVSLGIAYATIGLLSQIWFAWLFFFIMDGIALGLLWVLFMVLVWGDISTNSSEKFYAVGETPFFLTETFSLLLAPYLASIPQGSSFSLAAFFLFLAVLPLLYAPETLPEKKIRERELKQYIDKAKKVKESTLKN